MLDRDHEAVGRREATVSGSVDGMHEVIIESIRVGLRNLRRVVILREKDQERYLVIWIGPDLADAIAFRLQEVSVPRPLSHDLMLNLVQELGGDIKAVVINDLQDDTFFARIQVEQDGRLVEIDSRPSDAIALAVRAGVPLYATPEVLDRAGQTLSDEGEPGEEGEAAREVPAAASAEELEKLSAFREFVSGLDLDDLGSKGEESED
jgi:bifunctional DNase/RNase